MVKTLNEKLNAVSKKRRSVIQKRANQLISDEVTLRDLRLASHKTQQDLSIALHITQDGVSRLEKRSDVLLSTLNKYISALGGTLRITAEFPNRPSIIIRGISDISS